MGEYDTIQHENIKTALDEAREIEAGLQWLLDETLPLARELPIHTAAAVRANLRDAMHYVVEAGALLEAAAARYGSDD